MEVSKTKRANLEFNTHGRKAVRFSIPGATVELEDAAAGRMARHQGLERSPVVDLSRGGLSFLTNIPPKQGRVLLGLVYSEEEEPILLQGRIVYSMPRGTPLSYRYRIGVEFAPFSHHKWHNSLEALCRLEKLEALYCAQDDESLPGTGGI
jgi:hypothetical protein